MKHLMIRPIMPRITPEITENPLILVNGIVLLALTVLTAVFISLYASNVYKGNKKKAVLFFTVIAALTALSLFCFFGCAATTVKGIIFCLLLAFSSYEDIKTRECENYVHLMIVIAAFIGTEMSALPGMFLSALIIGGIMLMTAAVTKSSIGGADIKLSAACAFMLGTVQGMTGLMIGLILAVIVNSIKNRKKKHEGFPLIPYLAVGFTAAYFKAKIDRIFERLGLVPESVADVHPEKTKEKDAPERTAPDKSEADKFLDEVMAKPNPTKEEPHTVNPTEARTEKQNQSVPSSKSNRDSKDRSADARTAEERRPSVRKELKEIREEMDREKKPKGKTKNSPTKTAEHKAPAKKKKSKER